MGSHAFFAAVPEMIPPADYPVLETEDPRYRSTGFHRNQMITIEAEELKRLIEFHRMFTEYLQDRWNPERSVNVLRAYRAVANFYSISEERTGGE